MRAHFRSRYYNTYGHALLKSIEWPYHFIVKRPPEIVLTTLPQWPILDIYIYISVFLSFVINLQYILISLYKIPKIALSYYRLLTFITYIYIYRKLQYKICRCLMFQKCRNVILKNNFFFLPNNRFFYNFKEEC